MAAELTRLRMLIGGKAVDAVSGRTFESQNPYTRRSWAVVPDGSPEDVDAAVAAARSALDGDWGRLTGFARAVLLRRLGEDGWVEEHMLSLLTPVAVDLRFVLAVLKINSNLERIGDIAEGIAKYILTADKPFNPELLNKTETLTMYDEAINMLEDTLSAFENEDMSLARSIFQKDEFLDRINMNATRATCEYVEAHPGDAYPALINLSVIRRLERVGDQSKNIAEETIFYVEAKVLKHGEA